MESMVDSASAALATAVKASYFSTGSSISTRSSFQPCGTKTPNFGACATMFLPLDVWCRPAQPVPRQERVAATYVPAAALADGSHSTCFQVRREVRHCRTDQASERQGRDVAVLAS